MNGIVITDRTQLRHGGRILLGNNHLFRLNCPGKEGEDVGSGGRVMVGGVGLSSPVSFSLHS